jgi:kynurenine formamidase
MSRFRLLSYPLNANAPVWPGNPPAALTKPFSAIARGDDANTTVLTLFSHSGTHLDAPNHFNDDGPPAAALPVDAFIFFHPLVIEVPKVADEMVELADLTPHAAALADADLLFLRTGWAAQRVANSTLYVEHNPMVHPEAARYLLEQFPKLRGLAIDAPSVGAPSKYSETVETHRLLTGAVKGDGRFIIILEDLRIDSDLGAAERIYAWPLFIEESDGSPCTIVAEFPTAG